MSRESEDIKALLDNATHEQRREVYGGFLALADLALKEANRNGHEPTSFRFRKLSKRLINMINDPQ